MSGIARGDGEPKGVCDLRSCSRVCECLGLVSWCKDEYGEPHEPGWYWIAQLDSDWS